MTPWSESLILKPLREDLQEDARSSRSGLSLKDHESLGLTPKATMGAPETTNRCLGRMEVPAADDSDKADKSPISSSEVPSDQQWRSDDDENEDGRVVVVEQRHNMDGSSESRPGALSILTGPDSCGNGPVHGCGGCKGIGSWAR
ncbi:hypothetical protein Dimus_028853 [Dionaea muscipula]